MLYTVSDFLSTYGHQVRIIAGQGGLVRAIREVGILDYELVPGLTSRYQRTNFYEGQLVLSSFLYAREDPYLVTEAVKYLVSVGASGLLVKNVFHLEIPEAALRYANARNLPVMVITDEGLFFDNVIIDVGLHVRELEGSSFAQHEVDALLVDRDDPHAVRGHALRLNPSFEDEVVAVYAPVDGGISPGEFVRLEALYRSGGLAGVRNLLCAYDDGLLLVLSGDSVGQADADRAAVLLRAEVLDREVTGPVGVGESHRSLGELGAAILEAVHAARLAARTSGGTVRHADLGILRAVLPHASSPSMTAFSQAVMGPLRDFDAENNAQLAATLEAYLEHGRSVSDAAEALGTHPNTVRYRLGQVQGVTGLDWRRPQDMEQLALAHAIEVARAVAWE